MKTALLALTLIGIAVAAAAGLVIGWTRVDVAIPLIGWLAIAAGAALSIALGVGLMALSFHSARHGYDDAAHTPPEE